jgi:hypothetical protein
LVHDTLGTEPERIALEVMEDRVLVTVPVRNYPVSGISLLAQRTGRIYEVSETAATGTIDFMDNPERAGRGGRAQHTGEEIMAALAGYLAREKPGETRPQTTFAERIAHRPPEQLELMRR